MAEKFKSGLKSRFRPLEEAVEQFFVIFFDFFFAAALTRGFEGF